MRESLSHASQQYHHFNEQALRNQKLYRATRLVVLVLGLGAAVAGACRFSISSGGAAAQLLSFSVTVLPLVASGLGFLISKVGFARKWVANRAGAEAIKAEAFLYATHAEKYSTEDRDDLLNWRVGEVGRTVERIERGEDDKLVTDYVVPARKSVEGNPGSLPEGPLDPEAYLQLRVDDQIAYYVRRAGEHAQVALFFLLVTSATWVLTAVLGYLHVDAWVAVLTTLTTSLTAYATVRADDFLASSYRATARQLIELVHAWRNNEYGADLSAFAAHVEQVLIREHGGWMALVRSVVAEKGSK